MNFNYEGALDFRTVLPKEYTFDESGKTTIFLSEKDGETTFTIEENIDCELIMILLPSSNIKKGTFKFNFDLQKYAKLTLKVANITNFDCDDEYLINLNGENSGIEFYGSSILNNKVKKNTVIVPTHNTRATYSNIVAYEVLKDESKGFIRCMSDIKKGSSQSEAHQELRLLVLDEKAKADSDPVLLIDENDIIASHANAIGMLDEDQVFYLLSRGLNLSLAQELIVNGYFEPVIQEIEDEECLQVVKNTLKEMI